jgi:hypothetical protein
MTWFIFGCYALLVRQCGANRGVFVNLPLAVATLNASPCMNIANKIPKGLKRKPRTNPRAGSTLRSADGRKTLSAVFW